MHFGMYTLRDVDFWFAFDGKKLTLTPKDSANAEAAMGLTHREFGKGVYAYPGDPIEADPVLVLPVNGRKESLILYPTSVSYTVDDRHRGILSLQVGSWFLSDLSRGISGISVVSEILDCAYDIQGAVDDSRFDVDGKIEITSTRKEGCSFNFNFNEVEIEGYISYSRGISLEKGELPIKIRSQLSLSFQETDDYAFIQELVEIMHSFISFIAQGYGYSYEEMRLLRRYEHKGVPYLRTYAEYCENGRMRDCSRPKKVIPIGGIDGLPKHIFQRLGEGVLVSEHLPKIDERNSYDVSRLIMMLAALDKTLETMYKEGHAHSAKAIESKRIITDALDKLIESNASKRLKEDAKWLKKILNDSESMQSRMSQFGKDQKELFDELNGSVFASRQKRTAFFGRITKMRNKVAHGDFDIFKDFTFDDIEGVNQLLLSAQLVLIGVESAGAIARIVNEVY